MRLRTESGFSLVELMTVVGIIGILASVAVPNASVGIKKSLARNHMKQLARGLMPLRIHDDRDQTLSQVAQSDCTSCSVPRGPLAGVTVPPDAVASWRALGFDQAPRDPWGNQYLFDSNDEEFSTTDCRYDALFSAGPDGRWEGFGGGNDVAGDDIMLIIPMIRPRGCPIPAGGLSF